LSKKQQSGKISKKGHKNNNPKTKGSKGADGGDKKSAGKKKSGFRKNIR
jgi:hypothetical protein